MNPKTRSRMRVSIDDTAEAESLIVTLMGDNADLRREYIFDYAEFNKGDSFAESLIKAENKRNNNDCTAFNDNS